MDKNVKKKLKRRGLNMYMKYFYNTDNIINEIIKQYDSNEIINNNICDVIFDVSEFNYIKIYELITYYPKKLKELKYITDNVINDLYNVYGETILIMKESNSRFNVRGKLCSSALFRARENNLPCNITSEDIILLRVCPLLSVNIEYGNNTITNYSASLDKINPLLGYVKGNIQVVSMLANNMKSSATQQELITFSKNILKIYGD